MYKKKSNTDFKKRDFILKKNSELYDFSVLRELRKRENLNIMDVCERSGVSAAVISKLERNQTVAELDTLCRIARVFGMNPSELLALVEVRQPHVKKSSNHTAGGFTFSEIRYDNVKCLKGTAKAGAKLSRPEIHNDDYELCWVIKGKLAFSMASEKKFLSAGDAIQFDAIFEHEYEVLEDIEVVILHIRKTKRF